MLTEMINKIKGKGTKIVFPEGNDARVLEAAIRLKNDGILAPILLGNIEEINALAASKGWSTDGLEMIDIAQDPRMDEFVAKMVELRKGKMDE